jgi:hypothetical protein
MGWGGVGWGWGGIAFVFFYSFKEFNEFNTLNDASVGFPVLDPGIEDPRI